MATQSKPRLLSIARPLAAWLMAAAIVTASLAATARTQDSPHEHDVKAALLSRFTGYVQWPDAAFARPDSPIVIAVAGADPVYERLIQAAAGRTAGRRPVALRRLQRGESLAGVHMLFIGKGAGPWASELAEQARRRPLLVVTDGEPLLVGSVINFLLVDNRVRFDVSLEAAETHKLKLRAMLLSAARQVRGRHS